VEGLHGALADLAGELRRRLGTHHPSRVDFEAEGDRRTLSLSLIPALRHFRATFDGATVATSRIDVRAEGLEPPAQAAALRRWLATAPIGQMRVRGDGLATFYGRALEPETVADPFRRLRLPEPLRLQLRTELGGWSEGEARARGVRRWRWTLGADPREGAPEMRVEGEDDNRRDGRILADLGELLFRGGDPVALQARQETTFPRLTVTWHELDEDATDDEDATGDEDGGGVTFELALAPGRRIAAAVDRAGRDVGPGDGNLQLVAWLSEHPGELRWRAEPGPEPGEVAYARAPLALELWNARRPAAGGAPRR
jgi:hypothetical protein